MNRTILPPPAAAAETLFSEAIRIAMRLANAAYLARHAEAINAATETQPAPRPEVSR